MHACLLLCVTSTGDEPWNANSGSYSINWFVIATADPGGGSAPFFDYEIVMVYLWAALHERPTSWACDAANWPDDLRPKVLPSQSTMSRRLHTTEVQCLLQTVESRIAPCELSWLHLIDGKPLTVGSYSKDPDATWGYAGHSFAKGYKLHAIYGRQVIPDVYEVEPLNVSELDAGTALILRLKAAGYFLGDKAYDSNRAHEAARSTGGQLVAERKRPGTNLGHRSHSPGRLRSMALLSTDFGRALYQHRSTIERKFGHLTNHAGGLAPLPNWVRRINRVRLWVQAKLIIHATYVRIHNHSPPTACA